MRRGQEIDAMMPRIAKTGTTHREKEGLKGWLATHIRFYKGHRQTTTTIYVPYKKCTYMLCYWTKKCQKAICPLLAVPYKGVPYKGCPLWNILGVLGARNLVTSQSI